MLSELTNSFDNYKGLQQWNYKRIFSFRFLIKKRNFNDTVLSDSNIELFLFVGFTLRKIETKKTSNLNTHKETFGDEEDQEFRVGETGTGMNGK